MDTQFLLCGDIGCLGYESQKIYQQFQELQENWFEVRFTGCQGFCAVGPVLEVRPGRIFYQQVKVSDVPDIIEATKHGYVIPRLLYKDPATTLHALNVEQVPFYHKQHKIVLRSNGQVAPDNIDHYLELGGYEGLKKALK